MKQFIVGPQPECQNNSAQGVWQCVPISPAINLYPISSTIFVFCDGKLTCLPDTLVFLLLAQDLEKSA